MSRTRRLSNSEIIEKVYGDEKVSDALQDLICAIFVHGEHNVRGDTIKSVIANQIARWADHEEEAEGLDGDAA